MPDKKKYPDVDKKAIEDALSEAMTDPEAPTYKDAPKTRVGRFIERGLDKLDEARGTNRLRPRGRKSGNMYRDGGVVGKRGCKAGQTSGKNFSGTF